MQWNGNNQKSGWGVGLKIRDGLRQHAPEPPGDGGQAVVFECMNGVAHAARIRPKRNGAHEWWWGKAAGTAHRHPGSLGRYSVSAA